MVQICEIVSLNRGDMKLVKYLLINNYIIAKDQVETVFCLFGIAKKNEKLGRYTLWWLCLYHSN